jgi:hypothetical protein
MATLTDMVFSSSRYLLGSSEKAPVDTSSPGGHLQRPQLRCPADECSRWYA